MKRPEGRAVLKAVLFLSDENVNVPSSPFETMVSSASPFASIFSVDFSRASEASTDVQEASLVMCVFLSAPMVRKVAAVAMTTRLGYLLREQEPWRGFQLVAIIGLKSQGLKALAW